jgi:hypothetical protein
LRCEHEENEKELVIKNTYLWSFSQKLDVFRNKKVLENDVRGATKLEDDFGMEKHSLWLP